MLVSRDLRTRSKVPIGRDVLGSRRHARTRETAGRCSRLALPPAPPKLVIADERADRDRCADDLHRRAHGASFAPLRHEPSLAPRFGVLFCKAGYPSLFSRSRNRERYPERDPSLARSLARSLALSLSRKERKKTAHTPHPGVVTRGSVGESSSDDGAF